MKMYDSVYIDGRFQRSAGADAGYYVAPALFTNVTADMTIAKQEAFGPALAVLTYKTPEEALQLANAMRYGLSGAVWSADLDRAQAFAARMRAGQVVINGAPRNLATPLGGSGDSGFGRENGRYGIEEMLTYQSVQARRIDRRGP